MKSPPFFLSEKLNYIHLKDGVLRVLRQRWRARERWVWGPSLIKKNSN